MEHARTFKTRMQRLHLCEQRRDEGDVPDIVETKEAGAQAVIRVVGAIGDVVGERGALRLKAGEAVEREGEDAVERLHIRMESMLRLGAPEWAIVFDEPFQRFPGQVEPVVASIAAFEFGDDS